jgi:capsular exopolysaccharide synthesis family protein
MLKEDTAELRWLFGAIRRWLWLIVVCTLLGAAGTFLVSSRIPPVYSASTTLLVRVGAPADGQYVAILTSERLVTTYTELLTKRPVIEAAAQTLGLDPRQIEDNIKVERVSGTLVIKLSVENTDPRLAVDIANEIVTAFMETSQESRGARIKDIFVVEPATMTMVETPVRPLTRRNAALGALIGAMLGGGVAFLLGYLDDTIKSPEDIRQVLDLNTLGVIGRLAKAKDELVVTAQPRSPVAEAFRGMCTNIRFSGVDMSLKTLLVTSPGTGEGKSLTVANLAAAMAYAGLRVVAVDADLRRPRLQQLFGLDLNEHGTAPSIWWGLTGALLEGSTNGNLHPGPVEGLKVLPSGELPPNPAELAGSEHMRKLLQALAQQVDIVLLDSPPVLPVADATALAQAVDGVLLVVKAGRTRRGAARHAVESLRRVGANLVGVVLNSVPRSTDRYYGYYEDGNERPKHPRRRGQGPLAALQRLFRRR